MRTLLLAVVYAVLICAALFMVSLAMIGARSEFAPVNTAPTNFWFQSQHDRKDSTNMHNVTLQTIVGLLNETNTVTLTLRDGLVHVRVLP